MTPEHFVLWLTGVIEALGGTQPSEAQWNLIKERTSEIIARIVYNKLLQGNIAHKVPRPPSSMMVTSIGAGGAGGSGQVPQSYLASSTSAVENK